MSEIIQKWLSTRLGVILDLNLLSFGDIVKDGYLLAQLLYSYGLLSDDDVQRIMRADYYEYALQNWMFLSSFIKTLGIEISVNKLESIAHGDGMTALRLFYQLYLILNNKDKLYFITNKVTRDREKEKSTKAQSTQTKKKRNKTPDLESTAAVHKWHKNNYLEQYFRCKEIRKKYLEQFENIIKSRHVTIMESKKSDEELTTYQQLTTFDSESDVILTLESHLKKYPAPEFHCEIDVNQAKDYISRLKKKSRKFIEEKKIQKFMHKLFLQNLLENLLEDQRKEHVNSVSKKVLQQSYYEKQMETKLLEVRKQKDTIIYNRKLENEYLLKKKDEKFVAELFQQKHNVALANLRNDNERKRILELHKRLYKEKRERKYQKHVKIAQGIVDDIITLTMKSLEYKDNFKTNVPKYLWNNWIALFCTEQELTEPLEDVEEMLEGDHVDNVFSAEIYKQNHLDQKDMSNYNSSDWPWNLEELYDVYNNSYVAIKLGETVLGFTVHRVLQVKYPLPPPINTPVLPKVKYAACITGCTDETLFGVLDTILKKKHIIVVNIQSAINYCLNAFQKENPEEPEEKPEIETKKQEKEAIHSKKGEKGRAKPLEVKQGMEMKETQTPKRFPGEEIPLSPEAVLGEYALETMKLGLPLNERLIATMFVEYLKSLKKHKGWVLMNYPEDLPSAVTLECALTGHPMSYENEDEECMDAEYTTMDYLRDELFVEKDDEFEITRISKLVPNITTCTKPKKQKSYLNSFIYLMHKTETTDSEVEMFPYMEKLNTLKNFYNQLGCDNSMCYNSLDADIIRDIILAITRDNVFASDIYDDILQIVEETIQKLKQQREEADSVKKEDASKGKKGKLADTVKKENASKGKKGKDEDVSKGKKGKDKDVGKGKKGKDEDVGKEKKDKDEDVGNAKTPKEEVKTRSLSEPVIIVPPPNPGEEKWAYVDLPQSPEIQVNLATFWEEIEEIYLSDFKQIFFLRRLCQNAIIPYVNKICTHLLTFIERPDRKQEYVYKFQIIYNELENDLREDDEFKLEMHCRIAEFKSKLWDISFMKMKESESERVRIINENWFYEQTAMYLSIYNSALQLELDRCSSTYYFLQDYYYAMSPTGLIDSKFNKYNVKKYETNEKHAQYLINVYSDATSNIESNPYVPFLNTSLQDALNAANSWYNQALSNWKKIEAVASINKNKGKKLLSKDTPLSDLEQKIEDLVQEWLCAIEGENLRIKYRLKLINARAKQDLYELLCYGENIFHEIFSKIETRYNDELESVSKLCEVLKRAVEACESIQPRLILDGAKFYIESKELLYDDPLESPPLFKEEVAAKRLHTHFTIGQLSKLADIFFVLAPNDSIPTKSFVYIIQDMVTNILENTEDSLVPHYWQLLPPEKVQEIIMTMFGKVEYISWKDFIIYNLEVSFPTEMELQITRHQFRELDPDKLEFVTMVQFHTIQFWFEGEIDRPNTRILIKNLLAKLFKISDDRVNYSSLLLSFCKDKDPIIGVSKAFGLSMGKLICWDEEIGKNYIEILAYQKFLKEQRRLAPEDVSEELDKSAISSPESDYVHGNEVSRVSMEEQSIGEVGSYVLEETMPEELNVQFVPELCYVLPLNVILVLLTVALPWNYRVKCIEDNSLKETLEIMYESLRNEEYDCVFSHEFLNSTVFKNYLFQNNKFLAMSPAEMIQTELEICTCTRDDNSVSIID